MQRLFKAGSFALSGHASRKRFARINPHSNAKITHRLKAKQIALEDFFVFRQPVQALAEKIEILVLRKE
jgi:hypothetical protein